MLEMTGFRPQVTAPPAAARRPVWRHPAILWPVALLLLLLFARLVSQAMLEPEVQPQRSVEAATVDRVDEQWPRQGQSQEPRPDPLPTSTAAEAPGRTFIAQLNLQPRLVGGQIKGYVVRPDDPSVLKGTPLQPGDVLLEVDGLELDPARAAALAQNVGEYQDVFVRFERGNAAQEGILPLGAR
jgi:hypothetical protein